MVYDFAVIGGGIVGLLTIPIGEAIADLASQHALDRPSRSGR